MTNHWINIFTIDSFVNLKIKDYLVWIKYKLYVRSQKIGMKINRGKTCSLILKPFKTNGISHCYQNWTSPFPFQGVDEC